MLPADLPSPSVRVTPGSPHAGRPFHQHCIAFRARLRMQDIDNRQPPALSRRIKPRPYPLGSPEFHVRELHLPSCVPFFDREIKTDQRKREADIRFRRNYMLRLPRVDGMLMNEFRIAVHQCVGG